MITFRWTVLLEQLPRATVTVCRTFPISAVVPASAVQLTDGRTIWTDFSMTDQFTSTSGEFPSNYGYDPVMVTISTIVVGVLAFSALLGWMLLWTATSVERARRDPRYRRHLMLLYGAICAAGVVFCAIQVATRQSPQQIVSTLFMELGNVLALIQIARNTKAPPI